MRGLELREQAGWLWMDAPAPSPSWRPSAAGTVGARLLAGQRALPGGVKFGLAGDRAGLRVRAETPLTDGVDAAARERSMLSGLSGALQILRSKALAPAPWSERDAFPVERDLASFCEDAGWSGFARGDDSVAVDLGLRDAYAAAVVARAHRGLRASVELTPIPAERGARRRALALFFLRLNGEHRLVRASLCPVGAALETAVLEVHLASDASAGELTEALGALSATARRAVRESKLLRSDPSLAREFIGSFTKARTARRTDPRITARP